jgi:hypothetical protein
MLGGEREAPPMIRAQRDIIKLEKDYYEDRAINFLYLCIMASAIIAGIYVLYKIKG